MFNKLYMFIMAVISYVMSVIPVCKTNRSVGLLHSGHNSSQEEKYVGESDIEFGTTDIDSTRDKNDLVVSRAASDSSDEIFVAVADDDTGEDISCFDSEFLDNMLINVPVTRADVPVNYDFYIKMDSQFDFRYGFTKEGLKLLEITPKHVFCSIKKLKPDFLIGYLEYCREEILNHFKMNIDSEYKVIDMFDIIAIDDSVHGIHFLLLNDENWMLCGNIKNSTYSAFVNRDTSQNKTRVIDAITHIVKHG